MTDLNRLPRAGDELIAIDYEVAIALAELARDGENANAVLRRELGFEPAPNARTSTWAQRILQTYSKIIEPQEGGKSCPQSLSS